DHQGTVPAAGSPGAAESWQRPRSRSQGRPASPSACRGSLPAWLYTTGRRPRLWHGTAGPEDPPARGDPASSPRSGRLQSGPFPRAAGRPLPQEAPPGQAQPGPARRRRSRAGLRDDDAAAGTAAARAGAMEEFHPHNDECIENVLGKTDYNHNKVNQWTAAIVEQSLTHLVKLGKTYKYIVTCAVMQRSGAGLHTASSCFWDTTTDGACTVRWENRTMNCIVNVFAVAIIL
uniref:Dynein light chain Tctex-type 3 n=1 Tax=Falco tinnunculus TaxID=100819 RepID=A0A8C4V3Z2_FALTI